MRFHTYEQPQIVTAILSPVRGAQERSIGFGKQKCQDKLSPHLLSTLAAIPPFFPSETDYAWINPPKE